MKGYIEDFVKRALGEETSFSIVDGGVRVVYSAYPVGKAKYIYASRQYKYSSDSVDIDSKLELTAIVANGMVYIINRLLAGWPYLDGKQVSPDTAVDFEAYFKHRKKELDEMFCQDFFPSVDVADCKVAENCVQEIKGRARRVLLSFEPEKIAAQKKTYSAFVQWQDVADELCGLKDINACALQNWNEDIYLIKADKLFDQEVKRYIADKSCVTPLELELIEALRTVKQAKTVVVELERGECNLSIKADLEKLVYQIWKGDTCNIADAITVQSLSKRTALALGYEKYDNVPIEDIKSISYGGKKIFKK